jgi:hypothetical protein
MFRYDLIGRVLANTRRVVSTKEYRMPFWVKRIVLKNGEIVTERELRPDENFSPGKVPMVGDEILVTCRGRTFKARVIKGDCGRKDIPPDQVVPIRVGEI